MHVWCFELFHRNPLFMCECVHLDWGDDTVSLSLSFPFIPIGRSTLACPDMKLTLVAINRANEFHSKASNKIQLAFYIRCFVINMFFSHSFICNNKFLCIYRDQVHSNKESTVEIDKPHQRWRNVVVMCMSNEYVYMYTCVCVGYSSNTHTHALAPRIQVKPLIMHLFGLCRFGNAQHAGGWATG